MMIEAAGQTLHRIPIRVRLTLWYVILFGGTLTLLGVYLLARFQHSLQTSLDGALQLAANQTLAVIEDTHGQLTFQDNHELANIPASFPGLAIRLLSPDGQVLDQRGGFDDEPVWGPLASGYVTRFRFEDDTPWRTYTVPLRAATGQITGWLQATQSLNETTDTLQDLRDQLFLGIPLGLLLAGAGGYFLASRALRPIDTITETARRISARGLSQRLDYTGPADEVGRLAGTFDAMLARLQTAFEHERRFSADAAHELRTPLSVLKGQLEVTLSRKRQPGEYEATLQEMSEQVERLIRLSNGLLLLSRLDRARLALSPTTLNLADMLAAILDQLRPLAVARGLALETDIPPGLPFRGDSDHLLRMFINLLDNAVKYTPAGGRVTLRASRTQAEVQIVIHNTGPGISPEHLPHLFERFYRAETSRSRELGGGGLGLAIAREIARAHGGEITAHSERDQGATFSVHLPV